MIVRYIVKCINSLLKTCVNWAIDSLGQNKFTFWNETWLYGNFDIFFFRWYKMVTVHYEQPLQTSFNKQKNQMTEWLPCVCTFLVFSSSFMVMFPVPGPTSRTTSVGRSADCNQRIHRSTTGLILQWELYYKQNPQLLALARMLWSSSCSIFFH